VTLSDDVDLAWPDGARDSILVRSQSVQAMALAQAASTLERAPLELESLYIRWKYGKGAVLARAAGAAAQERAEAIAMLGLEVEVVEER